MYLHGNATIMVSDFERALKFYTKMLGFKVVELHGKEWASLEIPGLTIGLHPQEKGMKLDRKHGPISQGLQVKNLTEAVTPLQAKGILFHFKDEGPVKIADFEDPDGNPLYLVEVKT